MELLRRVALHPERAVLVVTHDNRVFEYGDRIVYMSDGRIEKVEERTALPAAVVDQAVQVEVAHA